MYSSHRLRYSPAQEHTQTGGEHADETFDIGATLAHPSLAVRYAGYAACELALNADELAAGFTS